jgi:AhpD family alkylhydroperoxidase
MTRVPRLTSAEAGPYRRALYFFARRGLEKLTGRSPDGIIEPLEVYGHLPGLLTGYAVFEQASAMSRRLPRRLQALAEVKTSTLTHCEYCIDISSQVSRQWGLTDEELLALPRYRTSGLFSELDILVLDFAVGMTRTPVDVPDEVVDRLRQHLDAAQLVELTHHVALENMRNRFNAALGIGAAGFSEGMVCAAPIPAGEGEGE